MESEKIRFADLLEMDIARKGMNQADLAKLLTEDDERTITEAAISMWKKRNKVPRKRLKKLIEIFGPDSELAKAFLDGRMEPLLTNIDFAQTVNRGDTRGDANWDRTSTLDPGRQRDLSEIRARSDARRAAYSQLEKDIVSAMPEHLQKNFEGMTGAGAMQFRYDYMSENAVVEISIHTLSHTSGIMISSLYRQLFRLALAQRLHSTARPRRYGLIVLLPSADGILSVLERIKTEAALMGLEFMVVDTPERAAKVIEMWETTRPDQDFD